MARVAREAAVPDLVSVLAERLAPTDLQSLMLSVYAARAASVTPADALSSYARNRFVGPSPADPQALAAFDAAVSQHKVLTTSRNSEVVADSTNVLALESAVRRRSLLRQDPRSREWVRLCASHRLVRGQFFDRPGALPHFRLLALTTAGRDEGSFRLEIGALTEQLDAHLQLLEAGRRQGLTIERVRVDLTDLSDGSRIAALQAVIEYLAPRHPTVTFGFDPSRVAGRGYYREACFFIHATTPVGEELLLTDGGFTNWAQLLLSNAKERLLIGGAGTERLCTQFRSGPKA